MNVNKILEAALLVFSLMIFCLGLIFALLKNNINMFLLLGILAMCGLHSASLVRVNEKLNELKGVIKNEKA